MRFTKIFYIFFTALLSVTSAFSASAVELSVSNECSHPQYQEIISKLHAQVDAISELKLQAEVALETYSKNSTSDDPQAASNPKVAKYKKILENSLRNKVKKISISQVNTSFSAGITSDAEKQLSGIAENSFNNSQIKSAALLEVLKDTNKIALSINKPSSDIFEEMARANETSSLIQAATSLIQEEFDSLEANLNNSIEKLQAACKIRKATKLKVAPVSAHTEIQDATSSTTSSAE